MRDMEEVPSTWGVARFRRKEIAHRRRRGPTPEEVRLCPELYGAVRLARELGRLKVKKDESETLPETG